MLLSTQREIREVVKLREAKNLTFDKIAEILGFSERTARRRYEAALFERAAESLSDESLASFPEADVGELKVDGFYIPDFMPPIERFTPLHIKGDAIITADFHIPLHDPKLVNQMITCARKHRVRKLAVVGDFFNMDTFSSYLPHQPEAEFTEERRIASYIMKALLKTFDEIYFSWGNHDFRLSKFLGYKYSFTECMKWCFQYLTPRELNKITFTDLDYVYHTPSDRWEKPIRLCHPDSFSSVPLTVAKSLAEKYHQPVGTAHSHHLSMGVAKNGKDLIFDLGGFFDKNRTEYIQRTTRHHEWVQGWTMFKDGIPTQFGPILGNVEQFSS